MQKENKRKRREWIAQWAISAMVVIAFAILLYFLLDKFEIVWRIFQKIITSLQPIIIGLVIAYLLNPVMKFVEKWFIRLFGKSEEPSESLKKAARGVGIVSSLVFMVAVVALLLFMLIPQLVTSITNLVNQIPGKTDEFIKFYNEQMERHSAWSEGNEELAKTVNEVITSVTDRLVDWAKTDLLGALNMATINKVASSLTSGVVGVVRFIFNFIIGIIVSIYLMSSKEKLIGAGKKMIYATYSTERANEIVDTLRHTDNIFGGFISGKIIDSAIIGVLCFIGVTILRMPYPLLLSVIVGVTNVIPFFGPYIGAVPTTLLVLLYNPVQGLIFLVFVLILQQIDGNIIGPKILGDSTGLSSFWVIFAILLGGGMFGILGMIIGVPTFAVIYYLIKKKTEKRLQEKELPMETDSYEVMDYIDGVTGKPVYCEKDDQKVNEKSDIKGMLKLKGKLIFRGKAKAEEETKEDLGKQKK